MLGRRIRFLPSLLRWRGEQQGCTEGLIHQLRLVVVDYEVLLEVKPKTRHRGNGPFLIISYIIYIELYYT